MKHELRKSRNRSRYVSFFFLQTSDGLPHRCDEEADVFESKYDQIEMLEANNLGALTEMSEAFRSTAKANNIEIVESVVAYRPRHSNPAQSKHSVWRTL